MKLTEETAKMLGEILLVERKKRGFSLEQIRQKLELLDIIINRSDIHRIERGERKTPNALLLSGLCQIYGLNQSELFQKIGYQSLPTINKNINSTVFIFSNINAALTDNKKYLIGETKPLRMTDNKIVAFVVQDDNMKKYFIQGDIVFLEKGKPVENNKIGVYLVNEEYSIYQKKILSDGTILLLTDSQEIEPIIFNKESLKEIGKIIEIHKEL